MAVRAFSASERRYGVTRQGLAIDAIAVAIGTPRWTQQFLQAWPEGSDVHALQGQGTVGGIGLRHGRCAEHGPGQPALAQRAQQPAFKVKRRPGLMQRWPNGQALQHGSGEGRFARR